MLTKFLNEEYSKVPNLLLCIGGSSGSGKTSLASLLAYQAKGTSWRDFIFAADDYFTSEGGRYTFDPTKLPEAHADCERRVTDIVSYGNKIGKEGDLVIVHNTFTAEGHYLPYKKIAKENGYLFKIVWVGNHHGSKDIHDVPAENVQKQSEGIRDLIYSLGTRPHERSKV